MLWGSDLNSSIWHLERFQSNKESRVKMREKGNKSIILTSKGSFQWRMQNNQIFFLRILIFFFFSKTFFSLPFFLVDHLMKIKKIVKTTNLTVSLLTLLLMWLCLFCFCFCLCFSVLFLLLWKCIVPPLTVTVLFY